MSDFFQAKLRRAPVARDFGLTILACEEGWHTITNIEPGGEGEQAGLSVGDRICEVDGKPLPRKLHSIVTYLPSRDSQEYVNLGVRRGVAKIADEVPAAVPDGGSASPANEVPADVPDGGSADPAKSGDPSAEAKTNAAEAKVVATKAKAKPGSLGLAAEAKAAAEADAAAADAKAAMGVEPESPGVVVHTSEGTQKVKPAPAAPATAESGPEAPATAEAGIAKGKAVEAKKQEAAKGTLPPLRPTSSLAVPLRLRLHPSSPACSPSPTLPEPCLPRRP